MSDREKDRESARGVVRVHSLGETTHTPNGPVIRLPAEVSSLPIKELDVTGNRLTSLQHFPASLVMFDRFVVFGRWCGRRQTPTTHMTRMQEVLKLSDNKISTLVFSEMSPLRRLRKLDLSRNSVSYLGDLKVCMRACNLQNSHCPLQNEGKRTHKRARVHDNRLRILFCASPRIGPCSMQ